MSKPAATLATVAGAKTRTSAGIGRKKFPGKVLQNSNRRFTAGPILRKTAGPALRNH
jgi:hypothetical protein